MPSRISRAPRDGMAASAGPTAIHDRFLLPMPKSRFLLISLLALAAIARADFPPPKVVAPSRTNLTQGGVPVPDRAPTESAHPAAVPLWSNGAPDSEARK